ncbi:MAG: SMC-Scp complex subunit ScpB [Anaerolineaceae bacterium]
MPEHDPTNSLNPTTKALEALLFAAPGLSSVEQLSQALNVSKSEVEQSLEALSAHLTLEHGLRLQKIRNQYQLITAPEHAEMIEKLLGLEVTSRLTQAALEVLAIVAYKQPTTRPEIDFIRGVNSDGVVKSLLAKGLIEELGRSEAIGRPILYGVTNEFFQHFGLESLDQLPTVDLEGLFAAKPSPETEETRFLKD